MGKNYSNLHLKMVCGFIFLLFLNLQMFPSYLR